MRVVKIITDFLTNSKNQYKRIIIFKDPILEVYKILNDDGSIIECEVKDSVNECIKKENMMLYFTRSGEAHNSCFPFSFVS